RVALLRRNRGLNVLPVGETGLESGRWSGERVGCAVGAGGPEARAESDCGDGRSALQGAEVPHASLLVRGNGAGLSMPISISDGATKSGKELAARQGHQAVEACLGRRVLV
ncbi:MAG: hypothetical protein ACE5JI_18700, partial [Acidobacteriota bacterium]